MFVFLVLSIFVGPQARLAKSWRRVEIIWWKAYHQEHESVPCRRIQSIQSGDNTISPICHVGWCLHSNVAVHSCVTMTNRCAIHI